MVSPRRSRSPVPPPTLDLRALAGPDVYEKGENLYRSGRVVSFVKSARTIRAQVLGPSGALHDIRIVDAPSGFRSQCPCGFERGPLCKHRVAVLLRWLLGEPQG